MPGQSLDAAMERIRDRVVTVALFAGGLSIVFLMSFSSVMFHQRLSWTSLVLLTPILLGAYGYLAFRLWRDLPTLRQLRLAQDGERIVAELLQPLVQQGATILHDIPCNGFNLDHVVLSPQGIYVIETKTRTKPPRVHAKITFDGHSVLVNGHRPDRDPVQQALALAHALRKILHTSTSKDFPVRPVILFPEWWVDPMPPGLPVWVLNPKALPAFIKSESCCIPAQDLQLATFHLTRYIHSTSLLQAQSISARPLL